MSARAQYIAWARARPGIRRRYAAHLETYVAAAESRAAFDLHLETGLPFTEAAWLAGMTMHLAITHPALLDERKAAPESAGFLYSWATMSPDRREVRRVDINERRFESWLSIAQNGDMLEQWYALSIKALQVIRGLPFDLGTLFDIAALRAAYDLPEVGPESFAGRCALEFYHHQPRTADARAPTQIPTQQLINPWGK